MALLQVLPHFWHNEVDLAIEIRAGDYQRQLIAVFILKLTHGLVPYTGIMPIELSIDHTGPMSRNVEDNALLLEVLAGEDGLILDNTIQRQRLTQKH